MFPSECKFIYYEKQGKPFIEPLAKERGCCLPVAKKHRCVNCYLCFAPPCPADYHCPNCNYHYETEGHYLDERNNFNCKECNNVIKLDPYFESTCNKCDKKYIPHGKHCPHIKNYCEEIKEKHIYAFSVFPKMKDSDDMRINKIINNKKEVIIPNMIVVPILKNVDETIVGIIIKAKVFLFFINKSSIIKYNETKTIMHGKIDQLSADEVRKELETIANQINPKIIEGKAEEIISAWEYQEDLIDIGNGNG